MVLWKMEKRQLVNLCLIQDQRFWKNKRVVSEAEIISILNGDKVIKGAGYFIDGLPDIVEDKRFWLHYEFKKAVVGTK